MITKNSSPRPKISATYRHLDAKKYLAPGGPWAIPTLDQLFRVGGANSSGSLITDLESGLNLDARALEAMVATLAGGLRTAGVRRGDVVAWQSPNSWEVVVLYRACWRLGAIAGPIHHQAGSAHVEHALNVLSPKIFLNPEDMRGPNSRFEKLIAGNEVVTDSPARGSDIAVALFTSGSTGLPKAALHTQRGLATKAITMAKAHGLKPQDVVLMPAPLAHISGLLNAVLIPGVVGMSAGLMRAWDPENALTRIADENVSFMIGPPTFFLGLFAAPNFRTERAQSLRLVSCGGAGITPAFVIEARQRLDCEVKRTYGSTEAPTVTTSRSTDDPQKAADTDGRIVGDAQLKIVDPTTRRELSPGSIGELVLRGPELFVGYSDIDLTRASISRGWFNTGDLAQVDSEGWLTISGRIKDVIIRGGENISAAEVERLLEEHPAVKHAVVVGEPNERLGERVCAFVIADASFDLDVCQKWFSDSGATRFTTPERIVIVDEFPLLAAGKPDRALLKDQAGELARS